MTLKKEAVAVSKKMALVMLFELLSGLVVAACWEPESGVDWEWEPFVLV